MRLIADTRSFFQNDPGSRAQFESVFGDTSILAAEFDPYWDSVILPQIPTVHRNMSEWAGAGSVDYPEAFALYCFVRRLQPETVLELGYAGGISSSCIARGLEVNDQEWKPRGYHKAFVLFTLDRSPEHWDVCEEMKRYVAEKRIIQLHSTDALEYLDSTDIRPDMTFSDADHNRELCYGIAERLRANYPNAVHLYHEWSMGWDAGLEEKSYVSFKHAIGNCYERQAFEEVFAEDYAHGGFFGSCGLGVVQPL